MATSYTRVTQLPTGELERSERVGLISDFDNQWHFAFGIDLQYEANFDLNLTSVETMAIPQPSNRWMRLEFRPKADGINDFTYSNYNDWAYLRLGLCRNVIDPGHLGPHKVTCP
jgi:hypothetical protein